MLPILSLVIYFIEDGKVNGIESVSLRVMVMAKLKKEGWLNDASGSN
jgi:hypothetical protein